MKQKLQQHQQLQRTTNWIFATGELQENGCFFGFFFHRIDQLSVQLFSWLSHVPHNFFVMYAFVRLKKSSIVHMLKKEKKITQKSVSIRFRC